MPVQKISPAIQDSKVGGEAEPANQYEAGERFLSFHQSTKGEYE